MAMREQFAAQIASTEAQSYAGRRARRRQSDPESTGNRLVGRAAAPFYRLVSIGLEPGGYWLIAGLMALESTLVPIPSEVIVPPAAYLAHTQGSFLFWGSARRNRGSWVGASVMYWAARLLGRPIILRFGRYVGLGQAKLELAERWCAHYGPPGVFFSRLLPVIRH